MKDPDTTGENNALRTWIMGSYPHNLWNMNNGDQTNADLAVSKTVYDPSPPGYSVPRRDAFKGLERSDAGRTVVKVPEDARAYGFSFLTGFDDRRMVFVQTGVRVTSAEDDYNGEIKSVRGDALNWTAASYSRSYVIDLYLDRGGSSNYPSGIAVNHHSYRAEAFPVRPTKEE